MRNCDKPMDVFLGKWLAINAPFAPEAQLHSIRNLKDFEAIIDSVVVSKVPHNGNEFDAFLVNDFNRGIKLECT